MQTTGNLGLKKPEGTDIVDIADLNGNMDILDNAVNGKVDKVTGKQLSTNDYTAAEKTKLAGIATGANNYVHPNHTGDVISTGDGGTAIAAGVIVNADVNASAGIDASKIGTGVVSNAEFGYLDGVTSGIQGQLNGKAPLVTTPQQTTADITYYVRTDGDDNNTGLVNTAGGAFRTIDKAVSMLPKVINHAVVINVAAGMYTEELLLAGFSGSGSIYVIGSETLAGAINYKIINLYVYRNSIRMNVNGFEFTGAPANRFNSSVRINENPGFFEVALCRCVFVDTTKNGVAATGSPSVDVYQCEISNKQFACFSSYASHLTVQDFLGSGNSYRFRGSGGGLISYFGTTSSGTDVSDAGSIVISTVGVLNPWGDNTWGSRPASRAITSSSVQQSLSAGVWAKIDFTQEVFDNLNNYNSITSRFTAPQNGIYQINASVVFLNPIGNGACELNLFQNGVNIRRFDYKIATALSSLSVQGSAAILMAAGDYIEIFARGTGASNLSLGYDNNFEVVKIA
ncbi:hypothetical protein [Paenibacillus sp. FSL H8-0260]